MKVVITGASGFIGARLLDAAIAAWGKENVLALSSMRNEKCQTIVYDLQGDGLVVAASEVSLLREVTLLIHAGAFIPKSAAEADDIRRCNQNILFTQQLLNLPFNALEKIIYISTVDVYAPSNLISEVSPTLPASLYGWSKLYCEKLISVHARQKRISRKILRVGHVYGPGEEKYAKFLPKAMQAIISGLPVELYGDGTELRSFIYVDDVVKAIFSAVGLTDETSVINVAGARAISIKMLLKSLIDISGGDVEVLARESFGVKRDLVFDTRLMNEKLLPVEKDFMSGLKEEYDYFAKMK